VGGSSTVVLGLGSLIQSDDAVGIFALRQLAHDPCPGSGAELIEGGTKGLDLLPFIQGASRLLILDAVDVGEVPGTIVRLAGDDLGRLRGKGSVHELAVADLLVALRMLSQEPEEIVLLGVQPARIALGTSLSATAEEALPALVSAARRELARWAEAREPPVPGNSPVEPSITQKKPSSCHRWP
jgi:hydrogenase maturation protease